MFLLLLSLTALGQGQALSPSFTVTYSGATSARGRIAILEENGALALQAEGDRPATKGTLVGLRRADRAIPPWPRGAMAVLANGDRIAGTVTGGNDRTVRLSPRFAGRGAEDWLLPLTALSAIWVTPPPSDVPADPSSYSWAEGPNRRDAVLLRNGDVLRGTVEQFTDGPAVSVKVVGTATTVPLSQVAAIAFDPALARLRSPKGPFARVVLADGSRISLTAARSDGTLLTGTTLTRTPVVLAITELLALDVMQGKAAYLSDLKPKRSDSEGYVGLAWAWAADRSVKGRPLRVGNDTFDKGLGTHPRTTLTYDLGGRYRRFEASVGLDPATGRRGTADVRVRVDGKETPIEGLAGLTATTSPIAVTVDVAGAKELTLVIDFGPGGDVQADVNWGNARLIE